MATLDGDPTAVAPTDAEFAGGATDAAMDRGDPPATAPPPTREVPRKPAGVFAGRRWWVDLVAVAALALGLRVVFGHSEPSIDPTYAFVWGREILHGTLPSFAYPFAPTAHPLPTLEAALVELLGTSGAVTAWTILSYVSFGALLWGIFRLGEAAFSWVVGAVAVALVVSNYEMVSVALGGLLDVQFVALIVWAAVLEVRKPRRGMPVLVLLTIAALLRPEAGLLAALYWVYAFYGRDRRAIGAAVVVLLAPLGWVLMDVVVTGHPFFAFTNARQSSEGQALSGAGHSQLVSLAINQLRNAIRAPVLLGGALGVVLVVYFRRRKFAAPGAVLALLLVGYAALLALRLPVPDRMLLTPALMLSVLCALAAVGWRWRAHGVPQRLWTVVGIALVGLLVATGPREITRLRSLNRLQADSEQVMGDLNALHGSAAARSAFGSCGTIWVGNQNMAQYVAYYLDRPLGTIRVTESGAFPQGAYVTLASTHAATLVLGHFQADRGSASPPGARLVAGNRSWMIFANGC